MVWVAVIFILSLIVLAIINHYETKDEIKEKKDAIQEAIKSNGIKVKEQFNLPGETILINDSTHRVILLIEFGSTKRIPYRDICGVYLCEGREDVKGYSIPMKRDSMEFEYINNTPKSKTVKNIEIRLELKTNEEYFYEDIEILLVSFDKFVDRSSYLYKSSYDKFIDCYKLFESIILDNIRYRKSYYGQK